MNSQSPEQLLKAAAGTAMDPAERQTLRHLLETYTQTYRPPRNAWALFARHAVAYSVALLVLCAGTATGFAQQSLPGDFLYPVRLAFNDRVVIAVAGDEDARMGTELSLMEQELDEEELVAARDLAEFAVREDEGADDEEVPEDSDEDSRGSDRSDDGRATEDGTSTDTDQREMELELRSLDRLLDDEETSAELQLSL